MGGVEIRPNKKLCTCFRCGRKVQRGHNMLHLDKWGSRWSICLTCVRQFGWEAGEVERKENLRKAVEL